MLLLLGHDGQGPPAKQHALSDDALLLLLHVLLLLLLVTAGDCCGCVVQQEYCQLLQCSVTDENNWFKGE